MSEDTTKIPVNFQVGIQWKDDEGRTCTTQIDRPHKTTGKREVQLVEDTFVGSMAAGAMHYYARLKVYSPGWTVEGNEPGIVHGGYGGKRKPPLHPISLDARRVLTKVERDMSGEVVGKIGETTYRFNDPESAKAAAIKLFHTRFGPGWVLIGECMGDADDYPVIAETKDAPKKKKGKKCTA